jgi:hypothetical protein
MATLLAMVSNSTVVGFEKSAVHDGLTLRIPSGTQAGEQEYITGSELFNNYKHYCLDYQGERNA